MAKIIIESTHVLENWYNVNIKTLAYQIIGPAAAGSAGPVPNFLRPCIGLGRSIQTSALWLLLTI